MTFLYYFLLFLHFVGWAVVLGGTVTNLRTPRLAPGVLHGAITALVTGVLMVGVAEAALDADLNHMKIGVKLVVAAVIVTLTVIASRRKEPSRALLGAIAGLTTLNIALAALWR
ncbi:hypothetical protein FHE66_01590 [Georgenia sp. 311]|uniref:Integral membrane protein n=1 Tax=Georgenia wutianyii TaxID=2585135 RepID=A0ABX5VTA9_9MICO|nr:MULTISPECIES: hypothetical protein [Georgenia]QDB80155.1 hypothetical protein FE251_12750 [Georgenia wutianyii]TNC20162.1 hypothetical protein FHE66_01590 [Georgenia sp. 311]